MQIAFGAAWLGKKLSERAAYGAQTLWMAAWRQSKGFGSFLQMARASSSASLAQARLAQQSGVRLASLCTLKVDFSSTLCSKYLADSAQTAGSIARK